MPDGREYWVRWETTTGWREVGPLYRAGAIAAAEDALRAQLSKRVNIERRAANAESTKGGSDG